jgi:NADH-quinone oxidoreductase subunit F
MNPLEYRIALRNMGDPDLEDTFSYQGLKRAMAMTQSDLIEELRKSQLRGRGGAGYGTADKWQVVRDAKGSEKYVICNAVDGDVRSKAAHMILENDPYSVLEGMAMAGFAVGASQYIVAVAQGAQDISVAGLEKAIDHMKAKGFLDGCSIEIREVPRALVAGEETALLRTLAGRQAMSVMRPPFPSEQGYHDKPTLVENVETLANVSAILHKGADWFCSIGTSASKGSKVVTLTGAVMNPCTVEVPFGTLLSTLIEEIGRTARDSIKAVQIGGPTGAYVSAAELDMPLSYETLVEMGGIIGSGSIDVVGRSTCAVEMTHQVMTFVHNESCGKCVYCREGTLHLADILHDIVQGEAKMQDLDLLLDLAGEMKIGAICGLGKSAPNPVVSSIRLFRSEFENHIKDKKCPKEKDKS